MERAWFKCGVKGRARYREATLSGVSCGRNLGVFIARTKRVAPSKELSLRIDNCAANPRAIAGGAARQFRFLNREAHPSFVLAHQTQINHLD